MLIPVMRLSSAGGSAVILATLPSLLAGCAGGVGGGCHGDKECAPGLSCVGDLPGGYCTKDCSTVDCDPGSICSQVASANLCLKACAAHADCRSGYQCFNGACTLGCTTADDCGLGYDCTGGRCVPRPGAPAGASCTMDGECSSQLCQLGTCAVSCQKDGVCPRGQTCALNPIGDSAPTPTTRISPSCVARRGTGQTGAACAKDADCDRGACQLGVCVEMCLAAGDCHGTGLSCATLYALLDDGKTPSFQACLPSHAVLSFPAPDSQLVPVPSIAQSLGFLVQASAFDFDNVVGMAGLTSPSGKTLYTPPSATTAQADFLKLIVRYLPAETSSAMVLPNSPAFTMEPGIYSYQVGSSKFTTLTTTAYLKLGDPPMPTGSIALNVYLPDLSGACTTMNLAKAQAGGLDGAISQVKSLYQQTGLSITSVNFIDAAGAMPTVVRAPLSPSAPRLPDVDDILMSATKKGTGPAALDVVLVKAITDQNGAQQGVLGIAGGIPGDMVLGTPHAGVIMSLQTLCTLGMTAFGSTMAHELGHTLGLFHNVEQSGIRDPLTDTGTSSTNVMYWIEQQGTVFSPQQGQVIRNNPRVQP
jgi:hypothetical protein